MKAGRAAPPTYAIIDSQSVKTTDAAEERGIDGGKKVKGRKRHILVDTMGNLLDVVVHAAHLHDTKSGFLVARKVMLQFPTIKAFSADAGYRKSSEEMMVKEFGCPVDISEKIKASWQIIPKPWVVERTFSWLNHSRRLAKDVEKSVSSELAFVKLSHINRLLKALSFCEYRF
ncbi:transposase [Streptococcus sp. Marseille-Q5986]|uniref:transposase n=1 Tax=Streptococcus sp. Marseille-Q5986 TaxID=2972782 RepID=UPI002B27A2B5|nr:transposase [Streptococcus sp. Marseille-Q5986]